MLLPLGYYQATNLSAAVSLPGLAAIQAKGMQDVYVLIQAEGANIRWRDDGTVPTATVGMLLLQNDLMEYDASFANIQFIQVASGGILNVTYYRGGL